MKVRRVNVVFLNVILIVILEVPVSSSVWNSYDVQASPISCETPKVILQSGTAGTSTIYTNSTSAKVSVVAPAPVPTYFPSGYSVLSGNWWNLSYGYRKKITVVNNVGSSLSSGYSVCLTENTTSLISAGKMLSSGNDLRIVYWNGSSSWVELDRDVIDINTTYTQVWFKTQADISAGGNDDNYYIYYGNTSAGSPPANKNNVYLIWDDFLGASLDASRWKSATGSGGSVSVSGSVVSVDMANVVSQDNSLTDIVMESRSRGVAAEVSFFLRSTGQTYDQFSSSYGFHNWYTSGDWAFTITLNNTQQAWDPSKPITDGTWYIHKVTIFGYTIKMYRYDLSYNLLAGPVTWTDGASTYASGYVGFRVDGGGSGERVGEYDWVKIRKYIEPEPLVSAGSEEPSYYVSGTVPVSVQDVDSDYLITRSVASDSIASAYYPSGYTLGGSTTKTSGGLSNLTSNDGVYMTFGSYTYFDYDYHYAESDSVSSTTQTAWQDKVTLTFTSVADAYLVIASAELRGSSSSYDVEAQLTIDGTTYAGLGTRPDETAIELYSHHFATFKAMNLTAVSHTFKIQYRSSSSFGTCSIQHARIAVFRIFNYAYAENEGSQPVSGGYADKLTKTFNIATAGEYLVMASAELNPASTYYSILARMGIDSAYQDEVSLEGEGTTSSWESYFTHDTKSFDVGSHTVSIQASSESGTHNIRRARVITVRLTDYFLDWESGKSDSYTTNGATSWADKLVVTFTPATQCKYLILAAARVGGDATNGESYHSSFDFTLDGTEEGWWHGGTSDDDDRITYTTLKNSSLSEASHSLKLRYHSESSTSPDAGMGSARIIAIPMCGLKAVDVEFTGSSNTNTWTQLEWGIDSAWTSGSVSVTLQLYNYTLGNYPTSGNGYTSYLSSATANTDETQSQTTTVNPTHFRDATGYWKLKVKGVKAIETQFEFKADWIEFKPTYYSEYTVSTEFVFSSMTTNTPTQLNFTVVTQYNATSVGVTIQVWNYSSSAYMTDGEGYSTYTSSGSNETTDLNINTNPEFYSSGGNAKIKVTGVLTTGSAYQQETNQIKLVYKYDASTTYDYVLAVTEQDAVDWKVNLTVYNNFNIVRLSSTTISFYDGTTSDQIVVSSGSIIQSEGPAYSLNGSTTIKIKMSNVDATSSGISYLYVYLKILVPDTSTYILCMITFEIT